MVGDPACRGPLQPSRVETRVGERQGGDDVDVGPAHEP
jgi:hypothetical protein